MKLFHFVNNTVVLKPGGYQCLLSCYGNAPSKNSVFGPLSSVVLSQNFSKEVKLDSPLPPSFLKNLMVMKLSLLFFNSLFLLLLLLLLLLSSSSSKKKHLNFASKNGCCYFVEVNTTMRSDCFRKKPAHKMFLYLLNTCSFTCDALEIVCFCFSNRFLILRTSKCKMNVIMV